MNLIPSAQNRMGAFGVFPSEAAAWEYCDRQSLRRENMDTIPLYTVPGPVTWRSCKASCKAISGAVTED